MALGNTYCVETVKELKNFNRSITTNMTYSNYTVVKLIQDMIPYIGNNEIQMILASESYLFRNEDE